MQPRFEIVAAERGAPTTVQGTVIQNALVVPHGAAEEFVEFNSDLDLIDAQSSFWRSVECEAKLNVELALEAFAPLLEGMTDGPFTFGPLDRTLSFERHFLITAGDREMYAVRLGRKNWKRKMALKVKVPRGLKDGILIRDMSLEEWSPAVLQQVVDRFAAAAGAPAVLTPLKAFYKTKLRSVCVHRTLGTVFGVSLDRAKVVGAPATLSQIEVEFWSQLVPRSRGAAALHPEDVLTASHVALCAALEAQLRASGTAHERTELTKSDWVRRVSGCAS